MQPTFGQLLRAGRKARGLTLLDAAARLGISSGYLSDVETGNRLPFDDARVERLADLLGLDVRELAAAALAEREPALSAMARGTP